MKKHRNPREKDDQVTKNIKMEITEFRKKKYKQHNTLVFAVSLYN